MTNEQIAAHAVTANAIELAVRPVTEVEGADRAAAVAVLRQAVALRKALESWIVHRATKGALGQ